MFHGLRKIISKLDTGDWFAVVSVALFVVCIISGYVDGNKANARHTPPTPQNQNVPPGIVYESLQRCVSNQNKYSVGDTVNFNEIWDSIRAIRRDKVNDSVLIELRELNNRLRMLDSINRTLREGSRINASICRIPPVSTGIGKIKSVGVGDVFDLEVFEE